MVKSCCWDHVLFCFTVTGVVVIFLTGAFNSVTKGNTLTLDAAYYKAQFESHTQ
jgi:hypothetical protein